MSRSPDTFGLNTVTKQRRRADGTTEKVFYYYHRKSGTALGNSAEGMTKELALEVIRQWNSEPKVTGPTVGTVSHLFALYRASAHFASLKEKTRYDYRLEMGRIEAALGPRMVDSLRKTDVKALRDSRTHAPYAANAMLRTLSAIMGWGVAEVDYVEHNPARNIPQLPTQPRDAVWLQEHRIAFMETANPFLQRAIATLQFTVQRTTDTLRLQRSAIYEHRGRAWINLQQGKTGALVALPLHAELVRVYAEHPVDGEYLCPAPDGTYWTYDSFAKAWDRNVARANLRLARRLLRANPLPSRKKAKAREDAKMEVRKRLIVGLQRRDLRRTGMVELALCGVPDTQIAALSGHSIERTRRILDTYIPRRAELALAAIETWEANNGRVVALNTLPQQRSLEMAIERAMNAAASRSANRR